MKKHLLRLTALSLCLCLLDCLSCECVEKACQISCGSCCRCCCGSGSGCYLFNVYYVRYAVYCYVICFHIYHLKNFNYIVICYKKH